VDYALLNQLVYKGDSEAVKRLTKEARAQGRPLVEIWSDGLIAGVAVAAEDMKSGIIDKDQMIAAAKAMKAGMSVLRGWKSIKDPAKALEEYRQQQRGL
jgi:methanogenic corrinoid protein MtbC1